MDAASLLRMGLTLALLLAVPALLLWLVRRMGWRLPGPVGGGHRLRIVARTAIDQRHILILIRRDAAEQLLLIGPNGTTILDPAITLSADDRAEQSRLADEQVARVAATEAAMAAVRARIDSRGRAALAAAHRLLAWVRERAQPSFAALVERAQRPPAVVPAAVPHPKPASQRQPRPRKRAARA